MDKSDVQARFGLRKLLFESIPITQFYDNQLWNGTALDKFSSNSKLKQFDPAQFQIYEFEI